MEQSDISFYFVAENIPPVDTVKKFLESCEAVDFSGTNEKVFYNGLEGFGKDVEYDFEIKPEDALKKAEEFKHSNFTLLEWQNDELLLETAELLEEINEKSEFKADAISILSGPHEILSLEDNAIIKANFAIAFYFDSPLKEDPADVNLRIKKDKDLNEKAAMLEHICNCKLKGFLGGS